MSWGFNLKRIFILLLIQKDFKMSTKIDIVSNCEAGNP